MDSLNYKSVIGLEVHVELKTKSKMFCRCSADYFGKKPNTHTCPVCLGLPGALPVPNKTAIDWCIKIGLALNCKVNELSKFDRKNYFYPDLPKGYQISQYDKPFCSNGFVILSSDKGARPESKEIDSGVASLPRMTKGKRIGITRVHMEEDTAKLVHQLGISNEEKRGSSLIDFNRSGVPLVEIVTEPDFESASEVKKYLQKLQQIVRYLEVSDADMEKGEMRLEPNISISSLRGSGLAGDEAIFKRSPRFARDDKTQLPDYKVEVKNINSFKFVEKAINFELEIQRKIIEKGKIPLQETRGWDEKKQITVSQRSKEEAMDYKYFPEPDIPPIIYLKDQISKIKNNMPELPDKKIERFKIEYGLSEYDSEILTREKSAADYFDEAIRANQQLKKSAEIKQIANWIINKKVDIEKTLPAELIQQIISTSKTAVIDESELEKIINDVLKENPKAVEDYKKGKENAIMFLVGTTIRKLKGKKLDTNLITNLIIKKLKS